MLMNNTHMHCHRDRKEGGDREREIHRKVRKKDVRKKKRKK